MNYATIKPVDIANGPGVRVSLFVSGCRHHCKGCFNAQAWDFEYGEPFTEEVWQKIFSALDHDYMEGITLLGGEPIGSRRTRLAAAVFKRAEKAFSQKDDLVLFRI